MVRDIVIATWNSGHFEFVAVGRNATDAKAALLIMQADR